MPLAEDDLWHKTMKADLLENSQPVLRISQQEIFGTTLP